MADKISPARRSRNMAAIRSTDMKPELAVRKIAHGLGYRYRLHGKDLPGKPDLVFGPRRKVIFVHGCFWHLHPLDACSDSRRPKSNTEYWGPKLSRNIQRDTQNQKALQADRWKVLVIWECETRDRRMLTSRLRRFLGPV
jgi:DNA mismatch endonuclease, patch repair protein